MRIKWRILASSKRLSQTVRAQGLTLAFALALPCLASTAHAVAETALPLQREVGRELALQTIYWVEKDSLPARSK
jgi:hypothetical protein